MAENQQNHLRDEILTVPNFLSFFRLALIPLFVWLYCARRDYPATGAILLLSGASDIADGFIARHFRMVSDLGKALDPIADKLTQAAMLVCLFTRFPLMAVPLGIMAVKEMFMGITGLLIMRRTGEVLGANWHGKIATALLDMMMIVHVFWYDIPSPLSCGMIVLCSGMILLSFILYALRNIKSL